jgi:hypothetical protein
MRNYYVSIDFGDDKPLYVNEFPQITMAQTATPPAANSVVGITWALFIISWFIVAVFFGFPLVFSVLRNCNKSKPKVDPNVSTYLDVTTTNFDEGEMDMDD